MPTHKNKSITPPHVVYVAESFYCGGLVADRYVLILYLNIDEYSIKNKNVKMHKKSTLLKNIYFLTLRIDDSIKRISNISREEINMLLKAYILRQKQGKQIRQ
jgi:hypothetical protein